MLWLRLWALDLAQTQCVLVLLVYDMKLWASQRLFRGLGFLMCKRNVTVHASAK